MGDMTATVRLVTARMVALAVILAVPCCSTGVALGAGDANREKCGAATEASPGLRTYLPDCRAYELVSPPYKEGGVMVTNPSAISVDGNDALIGAAGSTSEAGNQSYDQNRSGIIVAYHVVRTPSGWAYDALNPPATQYDRSALLGMSDDSNLATTLWGAQTSAVPHKEDIYVELEKGQLERVGPGEISSLANIDLSDTEELSLVGASRDLTHTIFSIVNEPGSSGGNLDVWPGDTTNKKAPSLYEYTYAGAPIAEPTLVGVKNEGLLAGSPHINEGAELISDCGTELGSSGANGSAYNAVSEDGQTVFFTALACGATPEANEIYARIDATKTVAISEPTAGPAGDCETCIESARSSASFQGASKDGTKVFFTTEQELLPGQTTNNLYEYDFSAPAHSRISLISGGSAEPQVQGVARISEDGSHVYFVAKGVLTGSNSEGQAPEAGADNLYVSEPDPTQANTARIVFVAKLLGSKEEAEAIAQQEAIEAEAFTVAIEFWEKQCPPAFGNFSCFNEVIAAEVGAEERLGYFEISETIGQDKSVWQSRDERPVQSTPTGRFLVFESSAALTADDTGSLPQLFEYDAEGGSGGEGSIRRVSIGENGSYNADGNITKVSEAAQLPKQLFAAQDLPTAPLTGLGISEDGSRVFFTSTAGLTPSAASGIANVFEYTGGNVYLLSDGTDAALVDGVPAVQLYGADASGDDVFFTTADQLVPQATDTQQALYDAREEGGFPAPVLTPGCFGDLCRGAVGQEPTLDSPGTASQAAGDNLAAHRQADRPKLSKAQRLTLALKACRRLPKRKRPTCRRRARDRYGSAAQRKSRPGLGRTAEDGRSTR